MEALANAGTPAKGGVRSGRNPKDGLQKNPPNAPVPLRARGIDKNLADRARKAAALPADKFEAGLAKTVKVAVAATEGDVAVVRAARATRLTEQRRRRAQRERELGARLLAAPEGKFGVVVEDFEWDDIVWSRETGMDRHAGNHYPTSEDGHTAQEIVDGTN